MAKKMRKFIFLALCFAAMSAFAETRTDRIAWKNEIRVGWGDQLFETLMWHNPTSIMTAMPASWQKTYQEDYSHNQHVWLEYQRRCNHWFSYGGMVDMSEVGWYDVTRDGTGAELSRSGRKYFYNVVIMPTVRFTYFHHPNVNLYSGLGLGVGINGGTEANSKGHKTDVGAAINFTVFGVSANYQRWFWTVDLGGLYSLKNANTIFMASSRIFNVSFGARF